MNPLVSVLMPVYNGEKYIVEAIGSILAQNFQDFEFVIVDDGSTDNTPVILGEYANYEKIKVIRLKRNLGIVKALNIGILNCAGKLIARMDADDIALPNRLSKQAEFMCNNEEIGVCGSWMSILNDGEMSEVASSPILHEQIAIQLLFKNCINHPSVMFRKQTLIENKIFYREEYQYVEDYDLWARLIQVTKLANLPEILMYYRKHASQTTETQSDLLNLRKKAVFSYMLKNLNIFPNNQELKIHNTISSKVNLNDKSHLLSVGNWLNKLFQSNRSLQKYHQVIFDSYLASLWTAVCIRHCHWKMYTWKTFNQIPLNKKVNLRTKFGLLRRCVLPFIRI